MTEICDSVLVPVQKDESKVDAVVIGIVPKNQIH